MDACRGPRCGREEARRHAPHGGSQQSLFALPLLTQVGGNWISRNRRGSQDTHQALSEHRHHGAHRCRQDHHDRARAVLHRCLAQDRRSARRRRHHGLDGAGAGAWHHDHLRRDHLLLERHGPASSTSTASTSSTPPGTSISRSRWSARCACSTAPWWCSAVAPASAAVRDRLAPGQQVRRAAHRVRQQDGPHRCGLPARRRSRSRSASAPPRCRSR